MFVASMGPGPKGREEPELEGLLNQIEPASMGPGPKGREERYSRDRPRSRGTRFNGARP